MKSKIIKLFLAATFFVNLTIVAQPTITDRLVVPNLCNGTIKTYINGSNAWNPASVVYPNAFNTLTLAGQKINCATFYGNDLYVGAVFGSGIYKYPNYANATSSYNTAPTNIPLPVAYTGSDIVDIKFDNVGNFYATVGTSVVEFMAPTYLTTNLIYSDATAYFGNIDLSGNLLAFSDYQNSDIILFNLSTSAYYKVNNNVDMATIPVANTNILLNSNTTKIFSKPEGIAFDNAGNLWVANNNDDNTNDFGSLVKITPSLLTTIQGIPPSSTYYCLSSGIYSANQATGFYIYNIPAPTPLQVMSQLTCFGAGGNRAQLGGITFNSTSSILYVNEEVGKGTLKLDIATLDNITTTLSNYTLATDNSNPGNGKTAIVPVSGALPLSLITFNYSINNTLCTLKWETSNEVNVKSFEIEKCIDGINFTSIGNVIAKNTTSNNDYSFNNQLENNTTYYRLKMIDIDGNFTYSNVLKVQPTYKENTVTIVPNPATDFFEIRANNSSKINYELVDITGKSILNGDFTISKKLNVQNIEKGIYSLIINYNSNRKEVKRICIQ